MKVLGNLEVKGTISADVGFINDFVNGGVVNVTTLDGINTIYNNLNEGAIALCIIGDSNGNYPSDETRVNFHSDFSSSTNYFFSTDAKGANVGDMLMITKQKYLLVTRCALKIIPLNDAKVATSDYNATEGIVTAYDKAQIHKVANIENTISDMLHLPTHNAWEANMNECLESGIYPWCSTGRPKGSAEGTHFTCVTFKSTTTDSNGYYTYKQTCYGREGDDLGKIYERVFFLGGANGDDWGKGWKRIDNLEITAIPSTTPHDEKTIIKPYDNGDLTTGDSYPVNRYYCMGFVNGTSTTNAIYNAVLTDIIVPLHRIILNASVVIVELDSNDILGRITSLDAIQELDIEMYFNESSDGLTFVFDAFKYYDNTELAEERALHKIEFLVEVLVSHTSL